ncbi:hypothetical protein DL96DRAFT_1720554 [Flagelloscypha sp. PMI_526]|nr:hypothetical protein DL96DRAFT_1720554 [Flagelloscypha sp. PMI_526]
MVWIPVANSTVATFPLGLPDVNVTGLAEPVGFFQPAPNLRGTAGIIVSCVTVLIIALYNSIHPDDVLGQQWLSSVSLAFITMLAPELMVALALFDYVKAKLQTAHFNGTLTLSRWTDVHSFVLEMKQFSVTSPSGTSRLITSRSQLTAYIRNGALRNEDLPTAGVLKELGKTHVLVKIFTMFQVLWVIIQCIARWFSHLPITLFELMTSCYAICAVLAYVFWMDKPYRMDGRPFVISCSGVENSSDIEEFLAEKNTDDKDDAGKAGLFAILALVVVGFILSILHFSAWNSHFPTEIEQRLWHIASVVHVCSAGMTLVGILVLLFWDTKWMLVFAILPMLSRLLLFGLSIAALRSLPAGAFIQPAWTNFIPHFS